MSLIKKVFILGLVVYLSYYLVFGDVLGRNDLTDKAFHLERAKHPLTFEGGYYAPLLHLIAYPLTFVMSPELAYSIIVPIILFLLLPFAFSFAWGAFDYCSAKTEDSQFWILFVAYMIPFCILNCTWAQALNMVFVLLSLGLMFISLNFEKNFKDNTDALLAVFVVLGFFSHTEGGLWILAIYIFYQFLKRDWSMLLLSLAVMAIVFYMFPFLLFRPQGLVSSALNNVQWSPWEYARILLLWLNPLALWMVWRGVQIRLAGEPSSLAPKPLSISATDVLLLASVGMAILATIFDVEYRSLLSSVTLLGLYGVYGVYGLRNPKLKIVFIIWQILWLGILTFGLVVSHSI